MNEEQLIILRAAIITYGINLQTAVAIEELSELQKELCKSLRGTTNKNNITEEIADVYIMLEQLKIIFNIKDHEINSLVDFKINRLNERLIDYENKVNL